MNEPSRLTNSPLHFVSHTLPYRLEHLPADTIGIVPNRGVHRMMTHSVEALMWLEYVSHVEQIVIRHARNRLDGDRGGERRFGKRSLDGNSPISYRLYVKQHVLYPYVR